MKDEDKKTEDVQPEAREEKPEKDEPAEKLETQDETPAEKPQDEPQSEEKPEVKKVPAEDEKPAEDAQERESGELDKLRAENLRLTTQLEAVKAGFAPDLTEEAVLLAENVAAKEGCDIKAALQKVAEKFPEWKKDPEQRKKEKKGGIRVGAPEGEKPAEKKPERPAALKRWNRVNY